MAHTLCALQFGSSQSIAASSRRPSLRQLWVTLFRMFPVLMVVQRIRARISFFAGLAPKLLIGLAAREYLMPHPISFVREPLSTFGATVRVRVQMDIISITLSVLR